MSEQKKRPLTLSEKRNLPLPIGRDAISKLSGARLGEVPPGKRDEGMNNPPNVTEEVGDPKPKVFVQSEGMSLTEWLNSLPKGGTFRVFDKRNGKEY